MQILLDRGASIRGFISPRWLRQHHSNGVLVPPLNQRLLRVRKTERSAEAQSTMTRATRHDDGTIVPGAVLPSLAAPLAAPPVGARTRFMPHHPNRA